MAVPFLSSITLNKNEVQDFKVFNLATDPSTLTTGDKAYLWYNTTDSMFRYWTGTATRNLLDTSSSISGSQISGNITGGSGSVANALTAGSYLTAGGTFDGSVARTFAVDAASANTASKIVARDASGNFSAGTITATLSGNASTATAATNVSGGAAGQLLYQSGLATTAKLGVGTDGYILTYDGTNTKPQWSASIPAASVSGLAASATTDTTNASNISSGTLSLSRLALANGQFYVGNASNNPVATAKSSIPLSGFGALTADLDIAGFNIINSGNVTSGSAGSTLATKGYVDSVAQGLDVKGSCKVASTVNITLSSPGSITIDGVSSATFTSGTTRILVKDQSAQAENGIYVWNGTGSAMTRASDADTWEELVGAFTFVEEGTANADSGWVCTANSGGTLGTTAVVWTKFSQAGSYTAGNGMVLSGGVFHFAKSGNYTAGQIPFASSTSAIGFSSNLFWDNANNRLGIGTASPTARLESWESLDGIAFNYLASNVNGNSPVAVYGFDVTNNSGESKSIKGGIGYERYLANGRGAIHFYNRSSSDASSITGNRTSAGDIKMTLDNSGQLGLGTTIPNSKLHVNVSLGATDIDGFRVTDPTRVGLLGITGASYNYRGMSGNEVAVYANAPLNLVADGSVIKFTAGSGGESARIDSSGNLGLGVTPSARLHTYISDGGTNNLVEIARLQRATTGTAAVGFGQYLRFDLERGDGANEVAGFIGTKWSNATAGVTKGDLIFGGSDNGAVTTTMTLDASGNLGVGVTTVGERIHASGNIKAADSAGTFPRFISEVGAKSWATGYRSGTTSYEIWEDSTTRLAIKNGGQVLVSATGSASAPAIALAGNPDTGLYWPSASDTLALAVGGSDAVYIDSSRRVGIGIIPATSQLHVAFSSSSTAGLIEANSAKVENTNTTANNLSGLFLSQSGDAGCGIAAVHTSRTGGSRTSDLALYSYAQAVSASPTERLRIKSTGQLNFTGLAADPTGAEGDLYFNNVSKTLRYHNNSAFQQLSRKYTVALNDGSVTVVGNAYTLTHNMGSKDITVSVRRTTDDVVVLTDVSMPTTSTATITFAAAITASQYTVTVIG